MTTARVPLGHSGIHVRPIGLGCMGMSQFYGPADPAESITTIHTAIDVRKPRPPRPPGEFHVTR